jgi:cytochrome c oxidase subunit 2
VALAVAATLVACTRPAALDPHGPGAARITDLWWAMFWLATVIYVGVMGFIIVALFRRRGANPGPVAGRRFIVAGGIVLPAVVLLLLFVLTLRALDASATRETAFTVQVTGRQF